MMGTLHLFRSPANAKRLFEALEEAKTGRVTRYATAEEFIRVSIHDLKAGDAALMPELNLAQDILDVVGDGLIAQVQINDFDEIHRHRVAEVSLQTERLSWIRCHHALSLKLFRYIRYLRPIGLVRHYPDPLMLAPVWAMGLQPHVSIDTPHG
ncbi:MAG: hypothetical protein WB586_07450 [Chthoniobacterales bacterium]